MNAGHRHQKERALLNLRASRAAREIQAIFVDADHWNRLHPEQDPIDVDPDGALRTALSQAMDAMLATGPKKQEVQ